MKIQKTRSKCSLLVLLPAVFFAAVTFLFGCNLQLGVPEAIASDKPLDLVVLDKLEIIEVSGDYTMHVGPISKEAKKVLETLGSYRKYNQDTGCLGVHGISWFIRTTKGKESHIYMLDAGLDGSVLKHNFDYFARVMAYKKVENFIRPELVEEMAATHGHDDHYGAFPDLIKLMVEKGRTDLKKHPIPIYVGSDDFFSKRIEVGSPEEIPHGNTMPKGVFQADPKLVELAGGKYVATTGPKLMKGNHTLFLGPVPRVTKYKTEDGKEIREDVRPWGKMFREVKLGSGEWEEDYTHEDSSLIFNVKDKGLVIVGGCSHAGMVNIIKYAQKLTGESRIYAILSGGLHSAEKPIMEQRFAEIKGFNPRYIVGTHCTSEWFINKAKKEMTDAVLHRGLGTVGSYYTF